MFRHAKAATVWVRREPWRATAGEVLAHLDRGMPVTAIARRLAISEETCRGYVRAPKLGPLDAGTDA